MKINKGDFIELDYTAKLTEENVVFDTTDVAEAKKAGLIPGPDHKHEPGHNHNHLHAEDMKPAIICVGEKQILPGLDAKLEGLEIGEHKIELNEEEAFGKKNTKLLKLMPINLFNQQKIRPFVGLTLDIDGERGVVRSISGGRVIVDFNHPLAGKKIEYSINIKRIVTDHKEQAESVLKMLRFPFKSVKVENSKVKVETGVSLPKEIKESLEKDLTRIIKMDVELLIEEKKEEIKKEESQKEE